MFDLLLLFNFLLTLPSLYGQEFPREESTALHTPVKSLDSDLNSGPDFRFASSDFTQDRNRILWQNVLTQELAHRFGSFLTSAAGNPFGMLGRAMAHWGVFFDADFSPMDGNDWVDSGAVPVGGNGDGTFRWEPRFGGGDSAIDVVACDLNDDSYVDLA